MNRRITIVLGVFTLFFFVSSIAFGAMRPWSLSKISKRSEHILVGKVKNLSEGYYDEWPGAGRVVFTDVTITVEKLLKGKWKRDEIVLQVPGGKLADGRSMHASEAPRFTKGEKVLVFTKKFNEKWWVCGYGQGKYRVIKKRVEGHTGYPVSKDILLHALERRIQKILKEGE